MKNIKSILDKVATLVARNKKLAVGLVSALVVIGVVNSENAEAISDTVTALAAILSAVL